MDAVVGQTDAEEHAREAEDALKRGDYGNGPAFTGEDGGRTESGLDGAGGGPHVRVVE